MNLWYASFAGLILALLIYIFDVNIKVVIQPLAGNLHEIHANDLHGLHDFLLVGYAGVYLSDPSSRGAEKVRRAVLEYMLLLPVAHPVENCRRELALIAVAGGKPEQKLEAMASTSWSCLPFRFSNSDFIEPFMPQGIQDADVAKAGRNPKLKDHTMMGICKSTSWDRTCSYWALWHSMAARAEHNGYGRQFLSNVLSAVAGGATQCKGCHRHFLALHEQFLDPEVLAASMNDTEINASYCSGPQCGSAGKHMDKLGPCLENVELCEDEALVLERADVLAYQAWLNEPLTANASFSAVVVLHNLVTASVATDFLPAGGRRTYACVRTAATALGSFLGFDFTPWVPPVPGALPGIGKHRLLNCPE